MRHLSTFRAAAAALLLVGAGQAAAGSHGVETAAAVTVTAEVASIDRADRNLVLIGPRGEAVEVDVGEDVRNFDQIEVGDEVKVTYFESIAMYVGEPGFMPQDTAGAMAGRAGEGEKPAGMVAGTVDIAASVLVIDRKRREVTLMLSNGTTMTTDVDESVKTFDELEIGDQIHARITRAVAVEVVPRAR